jgi:hypothetical protein
MGQMHAEKMERGRRVREFFQLEFRLWLGLRRPEKA